MQPKEGHLQLCCVSWQALAREQGNESREKEVSALASYTVPLSINWGKRGLEQHNAKKKRVCRLIYLNYFSFNFILSLYFSVAV